MLNQGMNDRDTLKNMTLEQLWELFPIELTPHDPDWAVWARDEIGFLTGLLSPYDVTINHIGSTAIPGIQAKPIVDILVEIPPQADKDSIVTLMESNGYICMSRSESRLSFNKGYTPRGYAHKVFHVHFHHIGDNAEIGFRDYLRAHPDVALDYERLKLRLLPRYRNDRDGYTEAKSAFIRKIKTLIGQ